VNELPIITVTLIYDNPRDKRTGRFRGGDGRYHVSVNVNGQEHELGDYATATEAAMKMNDVVTGHGYEWARDSARRLDAAQRADADVLTLDAVPGEKARQHYLGNPW
jgi:hypothetical protein